jgi:hypothetical protein
VASYDSKFFTKISLCLTFLAKLSKKTYKKSKNKFIVCPPNALGEPIVSRSNQGQLMGTHIDSSFLD